ncbi:MAG TPA: hypothetical protein VEY96_05830, partial [Actinomycetes bacterium]|nr:hypothetical protein [Actinomycetes bacterium]
MDAPVPAGPDIMAIVGGDVAGQVAVGHDIWQVNIGSVHGAVLTVPAEGFRLTVAPKRLPVLL